MNNDQTPTPTPTRPLVDALRALLADIEEMQELGYWFGPFPSYIDPPGPAGTMVEWPNLTISAKEAKSALAALSK